MRISGLVGQIREHTIVKRDVDRDSIVVDLGMNDGRFAREVHETFGCKVFGAEPNPDLVSSLGVAGAITCQNVAISASAGTVKFCLSNDNEASHIMSAGLARADQTIVEVSSVPLTIFLSTNHITRIDLLKIDIEGAELEIFEGPDFQILKEAKQITVEFHAFLDPLQRPRVKKIISRMKSSGFYCIDFSATWKDVLFVNQSLVKLAVREKVALLYHKYTCGVPALIRKFYREDLGTVTRKIISRKYSRPLERQT